MRVLIINQYYHPDIAATAQLCADLGEDLARRGHRVTALCGTAAYRTPHDGDRAVPAGRLPLRDEHRGVRIVRVPVLSPGEGQGGPVAGPLASALGRLGGGLLGRGLGYASFLAGALARLLAEERPDVVLALSTPPLVAALGLCLQALRGCRFVYWVQDVYPDLAVRLGVMGEGGAAARAFSRLSRLLYDRADAVVVLDEAMAARLRAQGAPADRLRVIDNWSDADEVTPQPPGDNRLRRRLGLSPDEFAVGYAGNMGRGHDFATVDGALPLLADDPVSWLFIGGGPQRAVVEAAARGLPRVRFLPPQARSGLRDALTAGDVGLVTLEADLAGLLVPSKVYGLLAAGRPVLYVGPESGRVAEIVEGGAGESVRNGDVPGLVAAVRRLQADPARRAQMGARARALFEARYSRARATARHAALLEEVAGLGAPERDAPLAEVRP